jgi:voltage-gated potassium channel
MEPLDSHFFSVVTLTTVGYGDLVPSTAAGKVSTIL